MIGHYLTSALAKFRKTPFTTGANILTLALGLACFIAAYGIATYWRSGDSHHPGAERIFYISQSADGRPTSDGGMVNSKRLADELRLEMPELEVVAQLGGRRSGTNAQFPFVAGELGAYLQASNADPAIFELFSFDFIEGGPETALRAPNDVVLTDNAARQLFGNEPALGKSISLAGLLDLTVSGVIAPMRQPSFMGHSVESPVSFDLLMTLSFQGSLSISNGTPSSWSELGGTTFVRLPPSMSLDVFQAQLDDLAERKVEKGPDGKPWIGFTAVPVGEITTQLVDARFLSQGGDLSVSAILLGLGALILLVACVNYANLAAAQAANRIKESGMRKVLGAGRRELLAQHMVEAGMLTMPALALAVLVVGFAAPLFQNALGVDVTYFLTAGPGGALLLAAVSVASAVAVSAWPAMSLARVRAADALGAAQARAGAGGAVSRVLVGVQFLSGSFLLIVVAVTQLQHAHLREVAFGRGEDPVLILDTIPGAAGVEPEARAARFNTFKTELLDAPEIRSVTASSVVPWIEAGGNYGVVASSGDPGALGLTVFYKRVGEDYFETFGIDILAGRALDPERDNSDADVFPVVIDRRLAESLGYADPQAAVGQTLYAPSYGSGADLQPARPLAVIVGVGEMDQQRLAPEIPAFGLIYGAAFVLDLTYTGADQPAIRIDRDRIPGALAAIQSVWDDLAPDYPFRARFADDMFEEAYAPFHKIAGVFVVLSGCALLISTIGLLAIAVHVTARRRREIGVRKTLGASTPRVLRLLIADFSKPVVIGNLIAWPLAWMAAQAYLQNFAERAPLTLLPFILSLAVTLLIAWIAVGGQAWKAARVKPALVLKVE